MSTIASAQEGLATKQNETFNLRLFLTTSTKTAPHCEESANVIETVPVSARVAFPHKASHKCGFR